ncbi:MAG TPA: PAS domain S-box protein [Methanolinea sp.]|nr:PAS domain S-box protein [Methanolinea sp.]
MHHSKAYSVLYIDDDKDLLLLGKAFLERMGDFSVEVTGSAKEGLALLAEKKFDAVISDYQMPSMTGLDLLKAIRAKGDGIPFIIFTGRGREEVVIEALNAGADFYLQKGGEPKTQFVELAHKVRQAVTRRRAEMMVVESRKRLADIIDFLPDATFAIDREGKVIAWNRAMEEMTGVSATEVLGMGDYRHGLAFYGEPRPMLIDLVLSPREDFEREKYLFTRREGTTLTGETILERKNGTVHHYWGKASRLYDENGEPAGAIESIRDITDRVRAEEHSRILAQVLDIAPASITIHDTGGTFLYANQKTFEIHGYTRDEFMRMRLENIDTPESAALIAPRMQEIMRDGEGSFTVTHRTKDGRIIPLHVTVKLASWSGRPAMISVATDLSERLKAEEEIRKREEQFRRIVETAHEGIWEMDENFRTTYVNPRLASLLGYTPEEMLGREITSFMPESELADSREKFRDRMAGKPGEYERRVLHRDGSVRIMHVSATPILDSNGTFRGSFAMLTDITEKKQLADNFQKEHLELLAAYEQIAATEEELRRMLEELREYQETLAKSEEKFRRIVETANEGIWEMDENFRTTYVNPRMASLLGYAPEEMLGREITSFMPESEREDNLEKIRDRMAGKPGEYERRFLHRDGSVRIMRVSATPVFDDNGTFRGSLTMLTDITEKKRIEDEFHREHLELSAAYQQITATDEELRRMLEELREYQETLAENERRYRRIISGTFDAMVIHREGKIIWANEKALEIIGASRMQDIVGRNVLDFVHPGSRQEVIGRMARMVQDQSVVMPLIEEKFLRLDGSPVDVEVTATSTVEDGKPATIVAFRDITDRKRMQEALMTANRKLHILNSITRHDIQNKVTVLSGYLTLLRDHQKGRDMEKCLDSLENTLHAIQQIIDFTRTYQDLGVRSPEWQAVSDVAGRVMGQFELEGIAVDLLDCSCEVFADPMLEKVFYNLIDNALRYGGGISGIRISCTKEDGDLVIAFEDDGVGIPDDQKEHIFEQGYGKGTGLGLFLSREILSITGIGIRECGTPGSGARFEIRVPQGLWRENL